MFCPHCKRWEIGEADVFCSWCRAKLVDFALSLDRNHLYVGDPQGTLNLAIKHTGTVGVIEVGKPHCDEPWITVDSSEVAGMTLRLNGSIEFPVNVDVFELPDQYHDVVITVPSSVGEREIHLKVVPRPEMQAILPEYTLLLDNVPDKVPGYLALTRGVLTVEALSTDVPWATVKLPDPLSLPIELDERGNSRLEFEFVFDEELLTTMSEGTLPAEYSGSLIVKYLELEPERSYQFHVNCLLPPLLLIAEELSMTLKRDVFTDKRIDIDLTLQNGERDEQGRAELEVLDIRIDVPWLQLKASVNYPLTIATGQYNQISFTATATDIGEGTHIAKIIFLTNTPGSERQKETFIEVNVRQMVDFDRVLAIDFGTVNSCCATFDKLGSQILIEIDRREYSNKPTTAPSTILYWDKVDGVRDYDIGNYPYQISFDPLRASSTVKQVKRSLGKSDRYTISYYRDQAKQDKFLAREVAADVLKRILERAETQLEGRISECIISHPSRFSLKQIDDFKSALISCGIKDENIQTIHEPVGAALNFLQENREFKSGEQYHLMVYDFGGGTTDITLLRVTNRKDEARGINIVTPRVLGASGDRWLGGEDVTDLVMQLALDRCNEVVRGEASIAHRGKSDETINVVIPFDPDNFNDPMRKSFANHNRMTLRSWAEAAKIEMSMYGDEKADSSMIVDPHLTYLINNKHTSGSLRHKDIVPRVDELNERLRPRLDKLVEMMKRLARNNNVEAPEVILLSGMSSALPIVREVIEEAFPPPHSEIYTPKDLKECVVKGASHYTSDDAIAGVYLDIDRDSYLSATTSRLGIRVSDTGQTKFKEIIDAGVPIGQSGLTVPVTGAILRRNTRIRILENTGLDDELVIKGKENPNITELRVFRLDHRLVEWERQKNKKITDQMLLDAKMELEISPNLRVRLIARVPEVEEPFEFEAEFLGW
jgi:molecular chaperone DnaK (HSP70)